MKRTEFMRLAKLIYLYLYLIYRNAYLYNYEFDLCSLVELSGRVVY